MCVCVCERAHTVGDYFSVNSQGLGRVSSIQELSRQAGWVGHRPTPDPRWGCQEVGYARPMKGSTRRMAQAGRSPKTSAGHPKPGGEGSGRQG